MKQFDLTELKKTARGTNHKQPQPSNNQQNNPPAIVNNRSYSEIHKSPTKSSIREPFQQSFYLSRWGRNIDGKQPALTSDGQPQPWANVGQGIIRTVVGEEHVLIVNNKYECFGYGSNSYGQLSLDGEHIHRPTQISSFKDMKIVNVVCGAYHSFVQNSKGEIYGFGFNLKGQLGIGSFQNRRKPSLIYSLLPNGIKNHKSNFFIETSEYKKKLKKSKEETAHNELSVITNIMTKMASNGSVDAVQSCSSGSKQPNFLLTSDEAIIEMACGPLHSLMLSNKNRLFSCGYGQKYALGIGTGKDSTLTQFAQVRIKGSSSLGKIEKIECGVSSSGFLSEGKVYIAGTVGSRLFQVFTPVVFSEEVIDFKLGVACFVVLTRKGEIFQIGEQLFKTSSGGSSSSVFDSHRKFDTLDGSVRQIFGGSNCFFATTESSSCYGWGDNLHNQITGVPDESQIKDPQLLKIPIYLNQPIEIIAGNGTTFLLSGKPLDAPSRTSLSAENEEQISSFCDDIPLKTSVSEMGLQLKKRHTSKYSHSNIYKTDEKNLLTEMGIKPRSFTISMEIDFNELTIQSQISEGGYGIIYKGLWRETTVAIKMFKIQSENGVKDFFSECAAMEALRHPNIVMFLGACTKPPNFAIVLEYCERGSLWSTIQNLQHPLTWQDRRRFALQTAKGVNYLHTSNPPIIHRDLKSLNLLLDDSSKVKLADFGWTKGLDNYMTGKIGTYQWMAPEVIASQKYSEKADVFSYGIILWEIASREPPFKNLSGLQVSMQVLNNDLRPPIPKKTPEAFVRLMKKCWDRQPSRRPSFKDIIKELNQIKL